MTIKVIELREKMAKLATDARAELDKINDKTDESTAKEIEGRFDTIMADHDKIGSDVEREERLAKAEIRAVEAKRPVEDAKAEAESRQAAPTDSPECRVCARGRSLVESGRRRT